MIFRTFGPSVRGTESGYSVCPLLEVDSGPPLAVRSVVCWVVFDHEFHVVHSGSRASCEEQADVLEAKHADSLASGARPTR